MTPNTVFSFDAWARTACCVGGPIVTLSFVANGNALGTLALAPPSSTGVWQPFVAPVNSGLNTSLTLQIFDLQTNNSVPGNDFALDDLSLAAALPPAAVPEPQTYALVLAGLGLLGFAPRRRRRRVTG